MSPPANTTSPLTGPRNATRPPARKASPSMRLSSSAEAPALKKSSSIITERKAGVPAARCSAHAQSAQMPAPSKTTIDRGLRVIGVEAEAEYDRKILRPLENGKLRTAGRCEA